MRRTARILPPRGARFGSLVSRARSKRNARAIAGTRRDKRGCDAIEPSKSTTRPRGLSAVTIGPPPPTIARAPFPDRES